MCNCTVVYGMLLLYNLPSKAILYISATYGFSPGVSAPSSTSRAYTLTTYASAPMKATTTPMLNIPSDLVTDKYLFYKPEMPQSR